MRQVIIGAPPGWQIAKSLSNYRGEMVLVNEFTDRNTAAHRPAESGAPDTSTPVEAHDRKQ